MSDLGVLSKEICIRCHREFFSDTPPSHLWKKEDDDDWNQGDAYCPNEYLVVGENEIPPNRCPYRLEHMMQTQREPVAGKVSYV